MEIASSLLLHQDIKSTVKGKVVLISGGSFEEGVKTGVLEDKMTD